MAVTSRIWTVAVVGCGIGRAHIEGYRSHSDKFRVAALCDVDERRLEAIGDEFRIARRTQSFDELLRMENVEIIDICTPPALHVSQIIAALAAGKDVVCEKPLSGSLADVDQVMLAEQEAAGRVRRPNGSSIWASLENRIWSPSKRPGSARQNITRRPGAGD